MKKTIELLKQEFQSSSGLTPQFKTFYNTFKKELTALLTNKGCTKIEVSRGHFYVSGFFTASDNKVYYFSLSDVRGNLMGNQLLYRTAKDYKDYSGGMNRYVPLDKIQELGIFTEWSMA